MHQVVSLLYLACISPYLASISPLSRLYLASISPISPLISVHQVVSPLRVSLRCWTDSGLLTLTLTLTLTLALTLTLTLT